MKLRYLVLFFLPLVFFSQEKWDFKKCIEYALENNISIKQAEVNSKIQEQVVKANTGTFLPNLSGSVGQNYTISKGFSNPTLGTYSSGNSSNFSVGFSSNWTIFNGFQNLNTYKKGKIDQEYTDTNLEVLKNDVSLNVVNAYLQLLFAKEQENVSKNSLELNQLQYGRVNTLFKHGSEAKASVYEAEANVARAEQTLVQAKNTVRSSKLNLTQLLQLPFESSFDIQNISVDPLINELVLQTPEEIYKEALDVRPEIKYAGLAIQSADKDIAIAKGAYLPSLNLGYNWGDNYYNVYGQHDPNFTDQLEDNYQHQFSLSLSVPLFNRWATKTAVQRAKLSKENQELNLENTKFALRQNIETSYIDALNAEETYAAAKKSVKSTKIALEYAEKRFKIGTANNYDFEQAKNNYIAAQVDLINAKYDYVFKIKVMEFYAGKPFVDIESGSAYDK
ncbi:MAG: TolC family protein [Flavobacteriales bacterium]